MTLRIADFTLKPMSATNSPDDPKSGDEFFKSFLNDAFLSVRNKPEPLEIDLEGPGFIASAFLRGSFGQLSAKYGKDEVKKKLVFFSPNVPRRIDDAIRAIEKGWQGS